MLEKLSQILEVGFKQVGHWNLAEGELTLKLDPEWRLRTKVLYAFTVSGELAYIGKTAKSLGSRLQHYKTPPKTVEKGATTNRKNNHLIKEAIEEGKQVEVFAFASVANHQIGGFCLDHAAGLEDDLIARLQPPWNGRQSQGVRQLKQTEVLPLLSASMEPRASRGTRTEKFRIELRRQLFAAISVGTGNVDILSRDLHIAVGGYPSPNHAMASCCNAMRSEMLPGDEVLDEPPKGRGACLKIRYRLPR